MAESLSRLRFYGVEPPKFLSNKTAQITHTILQRVPALLPAFVSFDDFCQMVKTITDNSVDTLVHLLGKPKPTIYGYQRDMPPSLQIFILMELIVTTLRYHAPLAAIERLFHHAPVTKKQLDAFCKPFPISRAQRLIGLHSSTRGMPAPNDTVSRSVLLLTTYPTLLPDPMTFSEFRALIERHTPESVTVTDQLLGRLIGKTRAMINQYANRDVAPSEPVLALMSLIEAYLQRYTFSSLQRLVGSAVK